MSCVPERPVALEMAHVNDVFISGIHEIEQLGSCSRFWLHVDSTPQGYDGPPERVIVAKLIVPDDILAACVRRSLLYLMRRMRSGCSSIVPPKVVR